MREREGCACRAVCEMNEMAAFGASIEPNCRALLDISVGQWHQGPSIEASAGRPHEAIFLEALHLVEQPDLRHAAMDLQVRRTRRRGRAGQPLLPHQGWRDRPDAALRAALGHL